LELEASKSDDPVSRTDDERRSCFPAAFRAASETSKLWGWQAKDSARTAGNWSQSAGVCRLFEVNGLGISDVLSSFPSTAPQVAEYRDIELTRSSRPNSSSDPLYSAFAKNQTSNWCNGKMSFYTLAFITLLAGRGICADFQKTNGWNVTSSASSISSTPSTTLTSSTSESLDRSTSSSSPSILTSTPPSLSSSSSSSFLSQNGTGIALAPTTYVHSSSTLSQNSRQSSKTLDSPQPSVVQSSSLVSTSISVYSTGVLPNNVQPIESQTSTDLSSNRHLPQLKQFKSIHKYCQRKVRQMQKPDRRCLKMRLQNYPVLGNPTYNQPWLCWPRFVDMGHQDMPGPLRTTPTLHLWRGSQTRPFSQAIR
ncbi:hypothetical protein KCU65_g21, partial [Aureobasidium melanogenum]